MTDDSLAAPRFGAGPALALGLEDELLLVDGEQHALADTAVAILDAFAVPEAEGEAKPDMYAAMVELTAPVSTSADAATRAISALRKSLPSVARPLVELKIASDGKRVVVYSGEGAFEPVTGQMVLDLEVSALRDDVVRLLRPTAGRERARTAYELYLHASQLDEDPSTMAEAESLYAQALELDPWLSIAYTNLGNIRFRRHQVEEAEALYRKALAIDPRQPEAQYNLGYVMLERGEAELAVPLFRGAIDADPRFSDAYFNLAMAFEQMGEPAQARPYWKSYIDLEPEGTWTEIARRHLS